MKTKELTPVQEIGQHGIDNLKSMTDVLYACDLHHYLYNQDYFIIGSYQAKEFLNKYGTFEAIEKIQKYENDNFGVINTDLGSPEKVANMLAYIVGEELLNECPTVRDRWNDHLTSKDFKKIEKELKAAIKNY